MVVGFLKDTEVHPRGWRARRLSNIGTVCMHSILTHSGDAPESATELTRPTFMNRRTDPVPPTLMPALRSHLSFASCPEALQEGLLERGRLWS